MGQISVMPSRGFRAQLREAMGQRHVVTVWRNNLENGCFRGYVGGVGAAFFLLWTINDDLSFGGLRTLRHIDVTSVEFSDREHGFYDRAMAVQNLEVTFPETFALDSVQEMVWAAHEHAKMITLEIDDVEEENESECLSLFVGQYVGEVEGVNSPDGFLLREISPDGEWLDPPSYFGWDEILGVTIADNYVRTLLLLADAPPGLNMAPVIKQRT